MAKKQKEETTNVNATANRDVVQRLNFLYQASIYLQSVTPPGSSSKGKDRQQEAEPTAMDVEKAPLKNPLGSNIEDNSTKRRTRRRVGTKKTTGDLARSYVQCMRVVGQKTTVKMDPSVKRSLCSGCSSTLIPGSSASIRVKKSPAQSHIITYTCLHCRATKRIPAPPNIATGPVPIASTITDFPPSATDPSPSDGPNGRIVSIVPEGPPQGFKKKKQPHPRPLPLFARPDAGHVIFSGNERLPLDEKTGFGVCFS